ncbi:MAG: Carbohydrate kinase, FGGY family [uncultured Thermoleophilia bacterium]|uniref:Carbohydrate kinase, FGGY family n=1 Tax=uncultured Thermoleophilia bacterium TaxID=1497501 RepID=A0A6J4UIU5_9ACTN|nr:MAG: Carbohydrate kinase, FGGY family [uncultured Thermoleophilia bacterium]
MHEVLIGLDVGTSSSKGVVCAPDGAILRTATRAHGLDLPRPGWAEHDAEGVWWRDVVDLLRELTGAFPDDSVAAVCVSGIGPCLLPATAAGEPLRPAILYGIDTRATREIEEMTDRYGAEEILRRSGSPLTSQAIGPKLAWLARQEPEIWARTRRLYMASSFVVARLAGEYVLDHHSASQSDPLYDVGTHSWNDAWARDIAPQLELPRLAWPAEVVGAVTASAGALTGLTPDTPVCAGTIDAWAEAVSVGVVEPGDLMLMYGTTMFLVLMAVEPVPNPRLWTTVGAFPGSASVAAGMATSGAVTDWFRTLVGGPPFETLLQAASEAPAGSEGLLVLPYFAGERTPIFDPQARGVICGLTLRHGVGHLYRAILEGTAYAVRHHLDVFAEVGAAPNRIVAVGGGTQGDLWTQIVSDVTGRPQALPAETVGAAYGDAFLAAVGVGLEHAGGTWARADRQVEPDLRSRARYDELYGLYRDLHPSTRRHQHALAAVGLSESPTG